LASTQLQPHLRDRPQPRPCLVNLAHEGTKRYREVFDLVHRREAARPNDIWQADHTELGLWVLAPSGLPARPWLTVIEDDYQPCGLRLCRQPGGPLGTADRAGSTSGDLAQARRGGLVSGCGR
jgi:hypothetical protein